VTGAPDRVGKGIALKFGSRRLFGRRALWGKELPSYGAYVASESGAERPPAGYDKLARPTQRSPSVQWLTPY
jgi:hypothetical protein